MKQTDVICEVHFCTAPICSPQFKARCALRKAYFEITPSLIEYSLDQVHQLGYLTLREFASMRRLSLSTVRNQALSGLYPTKKFIIKFGTRKKPGPTLCIKHPDFSPTDAPQVYAPPFGVQAGSSESQPSPNLHAGLDFKHSPARHLRPTAKPTPPGSQPSRLRPTAKKEKP